MPDLRIAVHHTIVTASAVIGCFWAASKSSIAAKIIDQSQGAAVNACALASIEEISAVTDRRVARGVRTDRGLIEREPYRGAYSSTCVWKVATERNVNDPALAIGGASFVILNVISSPTGSSSAARAFLHTFRDAARRHIIAGTPVPLKIGDDALWWGDGVAVRKGNNAFGISVHLVNARPKERHMEETLAAKLALRLPR